MFTARQAGIISSVEPALPITLQGAPGAAGSPSWGSLTGDEGRAARSARSTIAGHPMPAATQRAMALCWNQTQRWARSAARSARQRRQPLLLGEGRGPGRTSAEADRRTSSRWPVPGPVADSVDLLPRAWVRMLLGAISGDFGALPEAFNQAGCKPSHTVADSSWGSCHGAGCSITAEMAGRSNLLKPVPARAEIRHRNSELRQEFASLKGWTPGARRST